MHDEAFLFASEPAPAGQPLLECLSLIVSHSERAGRAFRNQSVLPGPSTEAAVSFDRLNALATRESAWKLIRTAAPPSGPLSSPAGRGCNPCRLRIRSIGLWPPQVLPDRRASLRTT